MKKNQKTALTLLLVVATVFGCTNDHFQFNQIEFDASVYSESSEAQLKREFGKSLSKALVAEKDVRSFLKQHALKMMNSDYDVTYALVKHQVLNNGQTFRETLKNYFNDPADLAEIESTLPLLTIFIPSLPENSFSAEKWNTETEIPYVAITLNSTRDIPLISPEGEEYLLDSELIPSYPVVVIKENERLISEKQAGFKEIKSTRLLKSVDGLSYKFVDDIFDRELQFKNGYKNQRLIPTSQVDQKLIDAFNIYQSSDGWQRDYIYYGITPATPNGQFSYEFVEHIRSFRITGDALVVYQKIADQAGDPKIKSGKKSSGWTEGYFEIKANTLIQSQNGVGSNIKGSYLVSGEGLFDVEYTIDKRGIWPFRYDYYIVKSVTAISQSTNIPLVNWDLKNYASTLRIDIEEVDNTTEVTESTSETVKFATNFGIDATVFKKIGLKFGASLENTTTNTVQRKYTLYSDDLGNVLVNFGDKTILSLVSIPLIGTRYSTREYANDIFSISVEPKRVQ